MPLVPPEHELQRKGPSFGYTSRMRKVAQLLSILAAIPVISSCGGSGSSQQVFIDVWGSSTEGTNDGNASTARFSNPVNVTVDPSGNVYVADYDSGRIRRIDTAGNVSTLTNQANFADPFGLTISQGGQLIVGTDADDTGNKSDTSGTIWSVDVQTGVPTVLVSNLGRPRGLCTLADGRIAVSDLKMNTVSILDLTNNQLTSLAGNPLQSGFVNGTGTGALFARPYGLSQQSDGSLLVIDQTNNCIRRVTLSGVVTTFAGTGTAGSTNGPVATATFNGPEGIATAPDGTIYVADTTGHYIRRISGGQVFTEAGNGKQGFVDGAAGSDEFYGLEGLALTLNGSILWVADGNGGDGSAHNRVRRLRVP